MADGGIIYLTKGQLTELSNMFRRHTLLGDSRALRWLLCCGIYVPRPRVGLWAQELLNQELSQVCKPNADVHMRVFAYEHLFCG